MFFWFSEHNIFRRMGYSSILGKFKKDGLNNEVKLLVKLRKLYADSNSLKDIENESAKFAYFYILGSLLN